MTYEQARSYQKELKAQGKTASTSKEYGKVEDYIKTLKPENYNKKTVASAYDKLSSGVTTTGGWTEQNLDKIEEYTGKRPQLTSPTDFANGGDLSSYLGSFQDGVYGSAGNVELRESIVNQLEPDMAKPEPLNRVNEYEKMRGEMGVADLETTLTDLKAQLEEQYASKRARTNDALGKPVAMGAIAGRVGEIERQETDRIDALGRQINVINDQLTTSYNVISQYMNFMSLDYQDATEAYNTEFSRNLQIYNLMDEEMDEQQATARANLQTYQNAITSGNMSYSNLSSDQRAFITKLEAQSGLPIGFTSMLKPDEKVIYSGTRDDGGTKYLDYITKGANGQPISKTITLGSSSSDGTEKERETAVLKDKDSAMKDKLKSVSGGDGNVSPDDWLKWMNKYKADTGASTEKFVLKFSDYINMKDNPARYYGYEEYYLGKKK